MVTTGLKISKMASHFSIVVNEFVHVSPYCFYCEIVENVFCLFKRSFTYISLLLLNLDFSSCVRFGFSQPLVSCCLPKLEWYWECLL